MVSPVPYELLCIGALLQLSPSNYNEHSKRRKRTFFRDVYELHRTEIAQPVARAFGVPTVFPIVILAS